MGDLIAVGSPRGREALASVLRHVGRAVPVRAPISIVDHGDYLMLDTGRGDIWELHAAEAVLWTDMLNGRTWKRIRYADGRPFGYVDHFDF